jgi:GntR family transcriptional regulator
MGGIKVQLDFRSEMPIYLQIVEQIETALVTGEIKPGDQLPTIRQLASELNVNFNTVARSYRLLDESGLISTQQGRGTYILDAPEEEVQSRLRKEGLKILAQRYLCEAARFGVGAEDALSEIRNQVSAWKAEAKSEPSADK